MNKSSFTAISLIIGFLLGGGVVFFSTTPEPQTPSPVEQDHPAPQVVPEDEVEEASAESASATTGDHLAICSFNVKWLGHYTKKDEAALADVLEPCDIVLVQELVAPPDDGVYPDGSEFESDDQADEFFDEMSARGFDSLLSEEDTGTNAEIHSATPGTEWWVAFFKPSAVEPATNLPGGFLAEDRSDHPDFERVPYAFPFRTTGGNTDFVLISVHLEPGSSGDDRRAEELGRSSLGSTRTTKLSGTSWSSAT